MLSSAPVVALPRTVRALPFASLGAIAVLAAAPTIVTVARGGTNLSIALIVAAVLGGAGLGYAVDDDAQVVLAASPTSLLRRRALRITASLLLLSAGWVATATVAQAAGLLKGSPVRNLLVEAVTAAGIAMAAAIWAQREALNRTGLAGAATAVLTLLVITAMSRQFAWLPRLGDGAHHERWLWLAAGAWALAIWWSRDPFASWSASDSR